jgi:hypothetical protein
MFGSGAQKQDDVGGGVVTSLVGMLALSRDVCHIGIMLLYFTKLSWPSF